LLEYGFKKDYAEVFRGYEHSNFYIGANTGFLTKTIIAALAPSTKEGIEAIRNWLNFAFPKAKHMSKDRFIAPRTLKTTIYNGETVLMGMAEVSKK